MQTNELPGTLIFVGASGTAAIEQEMEARGVKAYWACSIDAAVALLNAARDRTVLITELALADGNWRDLVERVRCVGSHVPIVLVTSTSTAELWWDALECGVEDILSGPLSASRLCELVARRFTFRK